MAASPASNLLRLNRDCLGVILQFCDLASILKLRLTTKDSFKIMISACAIDFYCNFDPYSNKSGRYAQSLLSAAFEMLSSPKYRSKIRSTIDVTSAEPSEVHSLFFSQLGTLITNSAALFSNLRTLSLSAGFHTLDVPTNIYVAVRCAALQRALPVLTHCLINVVNDYPDDFRSCICRNCPFLCQIELNETQTIASYTDNVTQHFISKVLNRFFPDDCIWSNLRELDVGKIYEIIVSDLLHVYEGPIDIGSLVVRRLNSLSYPRLSTLRIRFELSEGFLSLFGNLIRDGDNGLLSQIEVLDIDQGCEDYSHAFRLIQDWNEFMLSDIVMGHTGKIPILFPNLKLVRCSGFFPSWHIFSFIPSSSTVALQISPFYADPAIDNFFRNRYRPGLSSPTIGELYIQAEPEYTLRERSTVYLSSRGGMHYAPSSPFGTSCMSAATDIEDIKQSFIAAMRDYRFERLYKLVIPISVALSIDKDFDDEDELDAQIFPIMQCQSLEHLTIVLVGKSKFLGHRTMEKYLVQFCWMINYSLRNRTFPHLKQLDVEVEDEERWSHVCRYLTSSLSRTPHSDSTSPIHTAAFSMHVTGYGHFNVVLPAHY